MFSFGWLKGIDGIRSVAYTALLLAVNLQSDALRDLAPFVQFKKREKHS